MNFSALSSESTLGMLLRLPLRLIPEDLMMPILQGRMKGLKWLASSGNHGFWLGSYEYAKRLAFETHIAPGTVVYDIGAHAGYYSLMAAVLTGPTGKVVAFEPAPQNLKNLRRHLTVNGIKNVEIIEAAVSSTPGRLRFHAGNTNAIGKLDEHGELEVTAIALDDLCQNPDVPLPSFIKIDVEGAEFHVLCGAKKMLAQARPTIFLDTHGADVHLQCCELLRTYGYDLVAIDETPIEQSREILAIHRA